MTNQTLSYIYKALDELKKSVIKVKELQKELDNCNNLEEIKNSVSDVLSENSKSLELITSVLSAVAENTIAQDDKAMTAGQSRSIKKAMSGVETIEPVSENKIDNIKKKLELLSECDMPVFVFTDENDRHPIVCFQKEASDIISPVEMKIVQACVAEYYNQLDREEENNYVNPIEEYCKSRGVYLGADEPEK